jgi:hypothetical protein
MILADLVLCASPLRGERFFVFGASRKAAGHTSGLIFAGRPRNIADLSSRPGVSRTASGLAGPSRADAKVELLARVRLDVRIG